MTSINGNFTLLLVSFKSKIHNYFYGETILLGTREKKFLILIYLIIMTLFCSLGRSSFSATELKYREHEKLAYIRAGYAEASLYQQLYVQLVAPDVQLQLQKLTDEIAVQNGVDMDFRIHIINDLNLSILSLGSGDIFISMGYLDMVKDRDEIAFCLAREIAIQHRFVRLRDWEERYTEDKRNQIIARASSLLVTTVIHSAFNHYVATPIHTKIMEKIISFDKTSYPAMSPELMQVISLKKNLEYGEMSKNVGRIIGPLLGKVPRFISDKSLKLIAQLLDNMAEEADTSRRKHKDDLGLAYMGAAGFDPAAGYSVIKKIGELQSDIDSKSDNDSKK